MRAITTPGRAALSRRLGGRGKLHVLAPRLLAARAANVEGSREMLALTPAALYVQLVVAACNPRAAAAVEPAQHGARGALGVAARRRAQWFSGQTALARPAIARRLRERRAARTSRPA